MKKKGGGGEKNSKLQALDTGGEARLEYLSGDVTDQVSLFVSVLRHAGHED